ncbi:MAG TPA: 3-dehydroquinate synthase [Bacteroidota bacterium]|nr:3-dehydroquinate synthase [Bacteroidota bacterium]
MIQKEIDVNLGERSYRIYVGRSMLSLLAPTMEKTGLDKQLAIITDKHVARLYLKPLEKHFAHFGWQGTSIVVPAGEEQKSLAMANTIYTDLLKAKVGKRSTIVALGGGVIGDLAGFVAATYHRGVGLVQVPTTLLSQVDSSIGGKTAVNHPLGKNMIGAFYQPRLVWVDMEYLQTLPEREIVCGLGEIVKYGVIRDEQLFAFLERNVDHVLKLDHEAVAYVQNTCCSIKAWVTSEDERESGLRMILNFGHTVGHALEAAGAYRILKHGEAVLLGMMAESFIANRLGMISSDIFERIAGLVRRIPIKARYRSLKLPAILKAMAYDKKSLSGKKRFMLPTRIGEVKAVEGVDENLIQKSLELILER